MMSPLPPPPAVILSSMLLWAIGLISGSVWQGRYGSSVVLLGTCVVIHIWVMAAPLLDYCSCLAYEKESIFIVRVEWGRRRAQSKAGGGACSIEIRRDFINEGV